jgi:3-phosphoshikimate 1-carboxyvinyltransferase
VRTKRSPRIAGRWSPPGDKSLSHRALILAVIAGGRTKLAHANEGADVACTAAALEKLGARITRGRRTWTIESEGSERFHTPRGPIDCGNSGTTMRLLAGVLAACPFETKLTGDGSLSRRPMERVARPLRAMGARVSGRKGPGGRTVAPLRIEGGALRGGAFELDVASAQVKSALLLAGWIARVPVTVSEPHRSRDHTECMMRSLGARVRTNGRKVTLQRDGELALPEGTIPGDPSAAAFFAAAAAALPGSDLRIDDCLLNPTRLGFYRLLARIGARVELAPRRTWCGEAAGTIRVRAGALRAFRIGRAAVPSLVDEIPILAVLAAGRCRGTSRITGAEELRVKESDRIAALAEGLRALGTRVEELPDGLVIEGGAFGSGKIDARGDHRIAMAFTVAGLFASGPVVIRGASSAAVSHPSFERDLEALLRRRRAHGTPR